MEITKRSNQDRASITQRKCNGVTLEKYESPKASEDSGARMEKALGEQVVYYDFKAYWRNYQFIMSKCMTLFYLDFYFFLVVFLC